MALYEVTAKNTRICNGVRIEAGMSVEVACNANPISHQNGKLVHEAFMRKYGIDTKKGCMLTSLSVKKK